MCHAFVSTDGCVAPSTRCTAAGAAPLRVLQVAIVQCGGRAFSTVPLSGSQWAVCVGFGALTLLLRQGLRAIPTEPPSSPPPGTGAGGGGGSSKKTRPAAATAAAMAAAVLQPAQGLLRGAASAVAGVLSRSAATAYGVGSGPANWGTAARQDGSSNNTNNRRQVPNRGQKWQERQQRRRQLQQ